MSGPAPFSTRDWTKVCEEDDAAEEEEAAFLATLGASLDRIVEIKNPEIDAVLLGEAIAEQLKKRSNFRRLIKQRCESAMQNGARGIRISNLVHCDRLPLRHRACYNCCAAGSRCELI